MRAKWRSKADQASASPELPEKLEAEQRREYVRARAICPVLVSLGSDEAQHDSLCVDVSGSGILLAGPDIPDILQIGDRVTLQIAIASASDPVIATGTVVREAPQGHRAVTFDSIGKDDQQRLIRFVFERLRIERSRGLKIEERDRR